jgi:hypothetical protein
MNALSRIAYRIRAMRIDSLRNDLLAINREIADLERKQRASINRRRARAGIMATRNRPRVPDFLRRG